MNEEEKQAIEYLKRNNIVEINYDDHGNESIHRIGIEEKNIILNLIDKKQKEIEELEDRNKTLEIEFEIKKYCKVNELASDLIYYKNLAREYQGNCISKDKIREFMKDYQEGDMVEITGVCKFLLGE